MKLNNKKTIVIVGGGFAGVNLVNQLRNNENFDLILVDKNNYNFFPPLLYQVATGYLETSNISYPFRKLFRGIKNFSFRMGTVERVIQAQNQLVLDTGTLNYDYLVFATGTETNFFGMENVKKNSVPMKTVADAIYMRNTLLNKLEKASREENREERTKLLTIVVAGGGPTGVEISGMFAEMKRTIVPADYPELMGTPAEIHLVDGLSTVLAPMSEKSQQYTYKSLQKMGVKIHLNSMIKDYVDDKVYFADGQHIVTKTLIWAAGVTALVFEGIEKDSYGKGRRMMVDAYNQVLNTSNIYAIGDTCIQFTDGNFPEGHPQVAQVALQQGENLGKNFKNLSIGKALKAFHYTDKGAMAIIGRNKAVADLPHPKMHFNGFIAWIAWLFIHLISLINKGNRFKTLYNWIVSYFTKDQSLRVLIRPVEKDF